MLRAMSSRRKDELKKIADIDDLHVSPFREDGKMYGTPTWIWSVVVDNSLYVRAYNGTASRWYKAAVQQKRDSLNDQIDDAYLAKYKTSPYLSQMISERSRSASVKIEPIDTEREKEETKKWK